jgi:hypothetical protein
MTPNKKRQLTAAARRRGLSLSDYLVITAEKASTDVPLSPLALELERMALRGLGTTALARIRRRAANTGVARMSVRQIDAVVKRSRRTRHAAE